MQQNAHCQSHPILKKISEHRISTVNLTPKNGNIDIFTFPLIECYLIRDHSHKSPAPHRSNQEEYIRAVTCP